MKGRAISRKEAAASYSSLEEMLFLEEVASGKSFDDQMVEWLQSHLEGGEPITIRVKDHRIEIYGGGERRVPAEYTWTQLPETIAFLKRHTFDDMDSILPLDAHSAEYVVKELNRRLGIDENEAPGRQQGGTVGDEAHDLNAVAARLGLSFEEAKARLTYVKLVMKLCVTFDSPVEPLAQESRRCEPLHTFSVSANVDLG
jgi:hypothetical protein